MGRRLAHATFHESHATDKQTGLVYAIDLTPLGKDENLSLEEFTAGLISEFSEEVRQTIRSVRQNDRKAK